MILKATHHLLIYPFFKFYADWLIHRHFGRVEFSGKFNDRNLPVLLLANHFSWWDGFFALYLNKGIFRRKFHFMMLEEQLRKFPVLNRIGGYSVKKSSRSLIESINYTAELLGDKNNIVLLFPQGKIESSYINSFKFQTGISRIIQKTNSEIQVIFMANLIDYFSEKKPGVFMYVSEYNGDKMDTLSLQEAYNFFFNDCVVTNSLKSND